MSALPELGNLEASGLIEIAALEPELEYLFRHALVQEAAYSSLLKQDRRTLHRVAAETILSLYPARERELAGVIGMHFEQAGDGARAAQYLLTAGEHALERFANKEAAAFFRRAASIADKSQADLKLQAAIGAAKAGWTYSTSGEDVELLEAALTGDDLPRRDVAEAYFWTAFLRRQRGEVPETSPGLKAALDRAAQIGHEIGDPTTAALPKAFLGSYKAFTGNLREGAREMREALEVLEGKADPLSTAMVADFLALTYGRLGEFAAAEATIARSRELVGDGDEISRVDVSIADAGVALERGELDQASLLGKECVRRAEDLGAYACVVASSVMYGAATLALNDAPAARAPLERGNELCMVTNMAPMRTLIQGLLGSVRAQLGDLPGGVAGWDRSLASAREMHDRFGEAQTLWGRARSLARQSKPDWAAALTDLDRALALFEAMEARPSISRVLHDRADALRGLGREDEARDADSRSLELRRELGLKDVPVV